ncbi:hypothetical protein C8J57DRAFT_1255945 [Mycena rebaudengoi]|nr:hypothetical protein C8J57DRAFT_1255945 [Mycena rebaudengoi]
MNKHAQAETGRGDVAKLGGDVRVDSEEFWLTGCHVEDIREAARAREESGEEIRKCKMELRLLESLTLVWDWDWDWDEIGSKPWVRLISWMILVICHVIVSFILMGVVDLTKAPYTMLKRLRSSSPDIEDAQHTRPPTHDTTNTPWHAEQVTHLGVHDEKNPGTAVGRWMGLHRSVKYACYPAAPRRLAVVAQAAARTGRATSRGRGVREEYPPFDAPPLPRKLGGSPEPGHLRWAR